MRAGQCVAADADLADGIAVHRHLLADGRAGGGGHDAEVLDDERRVDAGTAELLVHPERGALLGAALDQEEPAQARRRVGPAA